MNSQLCMEMKEHLEKTIIPFWKNLKDEEFGGFYGYMDYDMRLNKKAEKGCILNSRILWFFSNAYLSLGDKSLLEYADHAYEFLKERCIDKKEGGVFWSVNYDGTMCDTTKHTYNQAFAIYALSSYYDASGKEEALRLAGELIRLIELKCKDEGGYKEAQNRAFFTIENDKLSENGVMAERTMNTLLHVLEAYTEFYRVCHRPEIAARLKWILDEIAEKIYNPKKHRQEVFFDKQMNSLIDLHSFGHDIETSWLVDRTTELLNDPVYKKKMDAITKDLADSVYKTAFYDHSLANESENDVINEWRVWWVQAETVVGFFNAWQKSGEKKYLDAAEDVWTFIKEHVCDKRKNSEWFWQVDKNGNPDKGKPILEEWKCPYHNGRMCMEIMKREGLK